MKQHGKLKKYNIMNEKEDNISYLLTIIRILIGHILMNNKSKLIELNLDQNFMK